MKVIWKIPDKRKPKKQCIVWKKNNVLFGKKTKKTMYFQYNESGKNIKVCRMQKIVLRGIL